MVSIKVEVRHTVHDNRFYFSFSESFLEGHCSLMNLLGRAGGNNIKLSSEELKN